MCVIHKVRTIFSDSLKVVSILHRCIMVSWLYSPLCVFVFVFAFDGDGDDCNNDTHRTCAASMYHCLHEFIHLGHARYPLISCLYFHLYFCGEESYDSLTYNDMITFDKQSLTPFFRSYQNIGSCC